MFRGKVLWRFCGVLGKVLGKFWKLIESFLLSSSHGGICDFSVSLNPLDGGFGTGDKGLTIVQCRILDSFGIVYLHRYRNQTAPFVKDVFFLPFPQNILLNI